MSDYSFDISVYDGPASKQDVSVTRFHTKFSAESLRDAVCSVVGIFSGCKWFSICGNVVVDGRRLYVCLYISEQGFTYGSLSSRDFFCPPA